MLQNLEGFAYASSIDLNMGYYHIELSPESRALYDCLGASTNTRNFRWAYVTALTSQEKMNELFIGMDEVRAYIDDYY
jgi:hypothetical protein